MDFIAGLSVGLTVIPQALAYAEVAGLPPQVKQLSPLRSLSLPCSSVSAQAEHQQRPQTLGRVLPWWPLCLNSELLRLNM